MKKSKKSLKESILEHPRLVFLLFTVFYNFIFCLPLCAILLIVARNLAYIVFFGCIVFYLIIYVIYEQYLRKHGKFLKPPDRDLSVVLSEVYIMDDSSGSSMNKSEDFKENTDKNNEN